MKKIEHEYRKLYGEIPKDPQQRFAYLLDHLKLGRQKELISDRIHHILNIHWSHMDFTIYMIPKATPRPRYSSMTNSFYVRGAKDNRDLFDKFAKGKDLPMINTPCKFTCVSYLPIPKSMSKADTILAELGLVRPISKPDWDNLGKAYSDMIQSKILVDDSLIVEGVSKKYYSLKPRIEIHIEWMDEPDCFYNYNKFGKKG